MTDYVWIVASGSYSSVRIQGVFSNLAAAEQFMADCPGHDYDDQCWIWGNYIDQNNETGGEPWQVLDVAPTKPPAMWAMTITIEDVPPEYQTRSHGPKDTVKWTDGQYVVELGPLEIVERYWVAESWQHYSVKSQWVIEGRGPDEDELVSAMKERVRIIKETGRSTASA